jgi:hypothetical protein
VRRLAAVLAVLLCAGCGGTAQKAFDAAEGPRIVLQDGDVGERFAVFDRGRQGRADAYPRDGFDPTANGRIGGWKARYRRLGGGRAPGAVVIESKVDLFGDADGAKRDFAAVRATVERAYDTDDRRLRALDLGDEAVTGTVAQGSGRFASRFYVVAWRDANATVWLLVNGLEPLRFAEAERLATAQAARLDKAR